MNRTTVIILLVLSCFIIGGVTAPYNAHAAQATEQAEKAPAPAAKQQAAPAPAEAAKAAPAKQAAPALPKDPTKAYITLAILAVAAILFFTEAFPLAVTAMLVPCALSIFKIISAKEAFANFGESNVVIFMAMFILGEGTFVTGFANKVGEITLKLSKGSETRLLLLSMLSVGALSAFLSNTGTTAVAMPMVIAMCTAARVSPGKILMPIAFAASMGGCITLVGTPPNLLINAALAKMGGVNAQPFGFFEFGLFGVPLLLVGLTYYLLIGRRFLPDTGSDIQGGPRQVSTLRLSKMPVAIVIFVGVVIAMAGNFIPLTTAAMLGAMLMVITRCLSMKEAFNCIDWTTIFLFAGMIAMSTAMEKSGAATMLATSVVEMVSEPYAIMAATCALTAIITNFMSNTATAALMAPLAIPIAVQGGISPLPIAMGIAMSASACFLTPIATPPNTLVMGAGGYKFMDYVRSGWGLQILSFILCVWLIPLIWPFKI